MCGRLDISNTPQNFARQLNWLDVICDTQARPRYNVPPGSYVPLMHLQDGRRHIDDLYWGYRPAWAAAATPAPGKKRIPVAINARLEKLTGSYWKPLLRGGRALVAASGWYEWTGEKGKRQPWHIHRKDRQPIFMLALANFGAFKENREESGFVLVTADAQGGMVDVHDRRPVVLSAADAALWLDPVLSAEQAAELARSAALGPEHFEWHRVSAAVNRPVSEGAELISPV
ncbi:MAG TPA: SOS response-associated peptidase family protein [Janthinobacterium sp.]|jgi:putative SOS response-associated peptidase YedK|nr:SOS response-associated peptidase family protein [Janthinobacterium sp.]